MRAGAGALDLKVPKTHDRESSSMVLELYKSILTSMLEICIPGVSTLKVSKIIEVFCGKSV